MTIPHTRYPAAGVQQRFGRQLVAGAQPAGGRLKTGLLQAGAFASNPFQGVEWSVSTFAFFAYIFAIVTYRVPIGSVSMGVALFALPLEGRSLKMPPIAILTFSLVGWALIGMLTTDYPDLVDDAVTDFAKVAVVLFVGINVLVTRARIRAFVVAMVIEWGAFPIRGTMVGHFIAHADVEGRAAWNFIYSNPNDLAGLSILALAVTLGMLAVEKRKWVQLGGRAAVAGLVLIIILTASRGAMIALVAFGFIGGRKYFTNVRAILSIALLAVGIVAIAPSTAWRRFSTISMATNTDASTYDPDNVDLETRQDQSSSAQRLAIWGVARAIIAENPLTGVGLGAYPEAHFQMWLRGGFPGIAAGRRDTHSTYLSLMSQIGIPGFLIFCALNIHVLIAARRARLKAAQRAPALALQLFNMEVGLYGYLVASIWGSYGALVPTYLHLMLMHSLAEQLEREGKASAPVRRRGGVPNLAQARSQFAEARP